MKINCRAISDNFTDVEFFLVCLFPAEPLATGGEPPSDLDIVSTPAFWSITSKVSSNGRGLVNQLDGGHVLFRGYESDTCIHSYSELPDMRRLADPDALINGVFAYLKIDPVAETAVVRTDALGVAPFFWRSDSGSYWFASHTSLLHQAGDTLDLYSWLSLLQTGCLLENRSFYCEISRVAPGSQLLIDRSGIASREWFDIASLPTAERPIDDAAYEAVEAATVNAVNRCLKLRPGPITLPFSSGYDSRRFFAMLHSRSVPFAAVTCQTLHWKKNNYYDLDLTFAPKIADAFGVSSSTLLAPSRPEQDRYNARRLALVGTESFMHGWAMPLMSWLAKQPPSVVFDGLAGDALGNHGYEYAGLHQDPGKDQEILVKERTDPRFFKHLSGLFPTRAQFGAHYRSMVEKFPPSLARSELVYLQSRTRRCISTCITMMHPPGQLPVFPYYDMEFVRTALTYHPGQKYARFFQDECLRRFYADYYDFDGTRKIPPDFPPVPAETRRAMDREEVRFTYHDLPTVWATLKYLSMPDKILLLCAVLSKTVRNKRGWLFHPMLLLTKAARTNSPYISQD